MPKDGYMEAIQDLAANNAKREYMRQWRRNNPDKVKAAQERYWKKKGATYLQSLQEGQA